MIENYIDESKHIARHYQVKVYYSNNLKWATGLAHKKGFTISLYHCKTPEVLFSTFFHELGHIHCKRNNIWVTYHIADKSEPNIVRRTALKAELWVDRWAINEMKKWKPELNYVDGYINTPKNNARKWLNENYLDKYFKIN